MTTTTSLQQAQQHGACVERGEGAGMSGPLHIEPARFGMTGYGIGLYRVRLEDGDEAIAYSLDAPSFIPRGSLKSRYTQPEGREPYHYVCATEMRP